MYNARHSIAKENGDSVVAEQLLHIEHQTEDCVLSDRKIVRHTLTDLRHFQCEVIDLTGNTAERHVGGFLKTIKNQETCVA